MTSVPPTFEREYYDANYRNYERQNPSRKLSHYAQAIELNAPSQAARNVLDIGCAFGAFLGALDPSWAVAGIDHSEYAIDRARQRVSRGRFEVVRDGRIPFAERFAAITAWDVIEHIPDLSALAAEVDSHLVDDGVFVFVVPVFDGPLGPIVYLLDKDPTHVHRRSRQFWLDWVGQHFQVMQWWGIFRYLLPTGQYIHWPSRSLRRIAPAVAVVARRRSR